MSVLPFTPSSDLELTLSDSLCDGVDEMREAMLEVLGKEKYEHFFDKASLSALLPLSFIFRWLHIGRSYELTLPRFTHRSTTPLRM